MDFRTILCVTVLSFLVVCPAQCSDPCLVGHHTVLPDVVTRSPNSAGGIDCDRWNIDDGFWYRFGNTGCYVIPNHFVDTHKCNTGIPIYSNTTLSQDFTSGKVDESAVTVCAKINETTQCSWRNDTVRIKRCIDGDSTFFIYRLVLPTYCNMGYCVEQQTCPTTVASGWLAWGGWSTCSTICGAGQKTRTRICISLMPALPAGQGCSGDSTETQHCSVQPCPQVGDTTELPSMTTRKSKDATTNLPIDAPTVALTNKGICDKNLEDCQQIRIQVIGDKSAENVYTCKITKAEVLNDKLVIHHKKFENVKAKWVGDHVVCRTEEQFGSITDAVQVTVYSDDGWKSDQFLYRAYDSRCYDCEGTTGEDLDCMLKDDYCYIEGKCFQSGLSNPALKCLKCDVDANPHTWSPNSDDAASQISTVSLNAGDSDNVKYELGGQTPDCVKLSSEGQLDWSACEEPMPEKPLGLTIRLTTECKTSVTMRVQLSSSSDTENPFMARGSCPTVRIILIVVICILAVLLVICVVYLVYVLRRNKANTQGTKDDISYEKPGPRVPYRKSQSDDYDSIQHDKNHGNHQENDYYDIDNIKY